MLKRNTVIKWLANIIAKAVCMSMFMTICLVVFGITAKASDNWYEDFVYTTDNQTGTLTITGLSNQGKVATELTIEATATIGEVQYATILGGENQDEYNHFSFYSNNLRKITIKDGVVIHGYIYEDEGSSENRKRFDYFKNMDYLEAVVIGNVDTTAVTDMRGLFSGCRSLTTLDLSGFDTQNVKSFGGMFEGCSSLRSITFGTFNTENALYMSDMFCDCSSLTSLDIHGFNTANVKNMSDMFSGCTSLATLNMSGLNVSDVEDISGMFDECSSLKLSLGRYSEVDTYDLESFTGLTAPGSFNDFFGKKLYLPEVGLRDSDLSSCDYIYYAGNPDQWAVLNNITKATATIEFGKENESDWTTSADWYEDYEHSIDENAKEIIISGSKGNLAKRVKTRAYVPATTTVNGNSYKTVINGNSDFWENDADTLKFIVIADGVELRGSATKLFYGLELGNNVSVDIQGLNVTSMTSLESMFEGSYVKTLKINLKNSGSVTNISKMFSNCGWLTNITFTGFDTANVTDMSYMFKFCGCQDVSTDFSLDLSGFATMNVVNMTGMFEQCGAKSLDLSSFNTAKVTNMRQMFNQSSAATITFGSNFKTDNVTDMALMFSGCVVKNLDLSGFNTAKVTDMSYMFSSENLETVNLSTFNTAKVTNMYGMFMGSDKIKSLDLSSFSTASVTDYSNMFRDMGNLASLDLTSFTFSANANCNNMFYGTSLEELYLPQAAMRNFEFTQYGLTIMYMGTQQQWSDLNNTVQYGVTMVYDYDPSNALVARVDNNGSESISMHAGESRTLRPTVRPLNATNKSLTWSSSNSAIATVDSNGVVRAIKEGNVNIVATSVSNPNVSATYSITVGVDVDIVEQSVTLSVGETKQLTARITPSTAPQNVVWESDDEAIASVDSTGKITAKAVGTTYISAKDASYPLTMDACFITVKPAQQNNEQNDPNDQNGGQNNADNQGNGGNNTSEQKKPSDNNNQNQSQDSGKTEDSQNQNNTNDGKQDSNPASDSTDQNQQSSDSGDQNVTTDDQTKKPVSPTKEDKKETVDKKQAKTSVSKVKASKKSFTVSWKKQTAKGIKGYEIQYSTNKKFKKNVKTVTISKAKTTSKKIKKLKSGKTYYVRVRTYKKVNSKKVYSKWSKAKSIKVK